MKKLILLLLLIAFVSCEDDDGNENQNNEDCNCYTVVDKLVSDTNGVVWIYFTMENNCTGAKKQLEVRQGETFSSMDIDCKYCDNGFQTQSTCN